MKSLKWYATAFALTVITSFAAEADGITFAYGGSQGAKLYSNDGTTLLQSWTAVNQPYSAHLTDSGTVWYGAGSVNKGDCSVAVGWSSIKELDWNGNTLNTITVADDLGGTGTGHHAITLTDNGTVLAIISEKVNGTCGEKIVEYDPKAKKVVWVWRTGDHEGTGATKLQRGNTSNDPYHINNVDLDTASNQITFSSHQSLEVFIIDRSIDSTTAKGTAGDIKWSVGNPSKYGATGTQYISTAVHSARWVKPNSPGAGNIVFYANQSPYNSGYATGYEFKPIYATKSSGEWDYELKFQGTNNGTSTNEGGMEKLWNGNWLVTFSSGAGSNGTFTAYEFDTTNGTTQTKTSAVHTWSNPGRNGLHRYPVCYGAVAAGVTAGNADATTLYNTACRDLSLSIQSVKKVVPTINLNTNNNYLELNNLNANSQVSVTDIKGSIKFSGTAQSNQLAIATHTWPTGSYLVSVNKNGSNNNQLVFVRH